MSLVGLVSLVFVPVAKWEKVTKFPLNYLRKFLLFLWKKSTVIYGGLP